MKDNTPAMDKDSTVPANPPREKARERRQRHGVTGAVVLIAAGVLFLLNNFGFLPWGIWGILWRFWPIFLVFAGLEMLLGFSWIGQLVTALITLAIMAVVIGMSIFSVSPDFRSLVRGRWNWLPQKLEFNRGQKLTRQIAVGGNTYGDAQKRQVFMDIGPGELTIEDDNSADVFRLQSSYYAGAGEPQVDSRYANGNVRVNMSARWEGSVTNFDGHNTYAAVLGRPSLDTDTDVKIGVGKTRMNLDQVSQQRLNINVGVGEADIILGAGALPKDELAVDVGVGSVKIIVPAGTALQVIHEVGLGSLKVNDESIKGRGTFNSSGYETAASRLRIRVKVGTGSVNISSASR